MTPFPRPLKYGQYSNKIRWKPPDPEEAWADRSYNFAIEMATEHEVKYYFTRPGGSSGQ